MTDGKVESWAGTCWFCHWGWPRPIFDIYKRAEDICGYDAMCYGPAHIVWADENFTHVEWCLEQCDSPLYADWDPRDLEAVRQSLRELAALPDELKSPPTGSANNDPRDYPPPPGVEMVKW